jgi:hypothetical protein
MEQPFFPAFRSRLAALGRRTVKTIRQCTLAQLQEHLRLLPDYILSATDEGPNCRERIFSMRLTGECFVWQVLKPNTACREVVRQVQTLFRLNNRGPVDPGDSAYVQARKRLPVERLHKAMSAVALRADQLAGSAGQLCGRPVRAVDCSSAQLPDTRENQKRFPQPSEQKPGCGFPVMKFMVFFSLDSGAVLNVSLGNLHDHDLRLLHQNWEQIKKGDIIMGDRAYGDYSTMARLPFQGADGLARLHQARKVDFRKSTRLGKKDGLFVWKKSVQQSHILSKEQWQELPQEITVRIIRFTAAIRGHRSRRITLVTTLLDAKLYPAQKLIALYLRRWRIELCLRDLKTTMGMEELRCKTPEMAEKELLAYMIAHNLIRCVMAEAASQFEVDLERLSFKGTLDGLRQYSAAISGARNRKMRNQLWEDLLLNLARDLVPLRPNRIEPRAVKKRRKPYPVLNRPRRKFKEISHPSRHWKNNPRDYRRLN